MKKTPGITEAEYEIMKIAWGKNPVTSGELIEKLCPKMNWGPKTVKTLINRLVKKEALNYTSIGKAYLYTPAVSREECVAEESESFLQRMFDGALMPMLTHFAKSKRLSPGEIKQLKKILSEEN